MRGRETQEIRGLAILIQLFLNSRTFAEYRETFSLGSTTAINLLLLGQTTLGTLERNLLSTDVITSELPIVLGFLSQQTREMLVAISSDHKSISANFYTIKEVLKQDIKHVATERFALASTILGDTDAYTDTFGAELPRISVESLSAVCEKVDQSGIVDRVIAKMTTPSTPKTGSESSLSSWFGGFFG